MIQSKYIKTLDIVLYVLYQLKLDKGDNYYHLNQIIHHTDPKLSLSNIIEIGKYLEAQGYINVEFEFGEVFASITPAGMVHIENNFEENDLISLSNQASSYKISLYGEESSEKLKKPVFALLDKMKSKLKKNRLSSSDIGKNLKIMRIELEKEEPDIDVIDIKIKSLEGKSFLKKDTQLIREIFQL